MPNYLDVIYSILVWITFMIISKIPSKINALYLRSSFPTSTKFMKVYNFIFISMCFLLIGYRLYMDGIRKADIIYLSILAVIYLIIIGSSIYSRYFKQDKPSSVYTTSLVYTQEHRYNEINEIMRNNPNIKIRVSAANSAMGITITADNEYEKERLIEHFKSYSSLFIDLNSPSYRRLYKFYIFLFASSTVSFFIFLYQVLTSL